MGGGGGGPGVQDTTSPFLGTYNLHKEGGGGDKCMCPPPLCEIPGRQLCCLLPGCVSMKLKEMGPF